MNRSDAEALVAPYVVAVNQYHAVSHDAARKLLGDEAFGALLRDRIRGLGPTNDTLYPWNVADAVQLAAEKA